MINWVFNKNAKTLFDESIVDEIRPIDRYPIWEKTDPYGRKYYGVANFCGVGGPASEDDDLSWLEWDGNEIFISDPDSKDVDALFKETIGIMKSWHNQLQDRFPDEKFVILASFDDGSFMIEECEPMPSFTLRFWKVREGQGLEEDCDYEQPIIKAL